ncbi:MAG: ATP-binding cassette domain-containing protein [Saprospiraceae bacterium]|nr:ATP-binding cassette domain-containing protein [Saprospiraceae bacterium]
MNKIDICITNIGKRFRYEWIFKQLSYQFKHGESYVVVGPNGSGKSTLMKVLSGHLTPSSGSIQFLENQKDINIDSIYKQVSFAAPYIDLIEELSVQEIIDFHFQFKKNCIEQPAQLLQFSKSARLRAVKFLSSGMKQRLKLLLAFTSETAILLLDEPTTNLDRQGVAWYQEMVSKFSSNRLTIIASNVEDDYWFCPHQLNILDYK